MRMARMQYIDQSGLYAMEDVLIDLIKQGKKVLLVDMLKQPRYMLERIDIIPDLILKDQIFDNIKDCLVWVKENVKDKFREMESESFRIEV
jgi:SulP family sulfate permease